MRPVIEFGAVSGEFGERAIEAPRQWRDATGTRVAEREGEYEYDLGGAFPVDRIAIDLGSAEFDRAGDRRSRAPVPPSRGNSSARPSSIGWSNRAAMSRARRSPWRVVRDATGCSASIRARARPAQAPPLRAGWQPQEIVFAARGHAPFTLAYGRYQAATRCAADCDAGPRIRQRKGPAGERCRRARGRADDPRRCRASCASRRT